MDDCLFSQACLIDFFIPSSFPAHFWCPTTTTKQKKGGNITRPPTNHLNTPKKNWVELDFCQFLKFWDSSTQLNPPKIIFTRTIQVQPTLNHGELPAAKVRVGKEPDGKLPFSINHKMRGIFVELTGINRSIIICFSKTRDAEANSFRASEIRRWWFRNPGKITS